MKNNVYPCKPQFYYMEVGFKAGGGGKGSKLYRYVFVMEDSSTQSDQNLHCSCEQTCHPCGFAD